MVIVVIGFRAIGTFINACFSQRLIWILHYIQAQRESFIFSKFNLFACVTLFEMILAGRALTVRGEEFELALASPG